MMHPTEYELNEYVDGTDGTEGTDVNVNVDVHVDGCAECAARVAQIRQLISEARELPVSIEPPVELWSELRAVTIDARAQRTAVLRSLRMPLAAAAILMIALGSVLTWWVTQATTQPQVIVRMAPAGASHPTLVALNRAEADHNDVTRTLLQVLEQRRGEMDPEVVAAVEENLRVINAAIESAKTALAADPANRDVADILSATYQAKTRMLRRAVRVSSDI